MKRSLYFFTFFLLNFHLNAQVVEKNALYEVTYSEMYQQPLIVKYEYPNPFEYIASDNSVEFINLQYDSLAILKMPDIKRLEYEGIVYDSLRSYYSDANGKLYTRGVDRVTRKLDIEYIGVKEVIIDTVITKTEKIDFEKPQGIITSDENDYSDPYDKGHIVPVESFKDDEENLDFLWSYLNCAMMHKTLNRGVWANLEKYERELSKSSLLDVSVIVSFAPNNIVSSGASIPSFFTKILDYKKIEGSKIIHVREVYTFPNNKTVKGKKRESFMVKSLSY